MALPPRFHARGFSLSELFVVVGIVALLVAIISPAVVHVRHALMTTFCANNLRQIGQAIAVHRSEHGEWPRATLIPKPFEVLNPGKALPLYYALVPILPPASTVYRCPADPIVWRDIAALEPDGHGISYLYSIWDRVSGMPHEELMQSPIVMDFVNSTKQYGLIRPPHPGRVINCLHRDGSVDALQVVQ